ncbi:Mut7-C RNAse domain-containing protein [Nocardia cyriacigeorgica]|uniref:Mut7-C RNAse domain-containing protein n=1 Tax=Nocardia cyriacigeorgica TaxID=135487 RepID=UPI0024583F15|nr:Mut7-C RNAse domain-containing protein [Nocardia cyriacigeorgica]
MRCGGLLDDVDKRDIADRLPPLTLRYYETFRQCRGCGRVYWAGARGPHSSPHPPPR